MKNYHNILGIPQGANKNTIKKAYRKLALKYHPDRNRSADAKEKFLEISFAYEMLTSPTFNSQQRETAEFNQAQHEAKKQYKARRQAEAYARMKRKEFMNSESYKMDQAELALLDQLHLITAFFMVFIMPILSYLLWDLTGFFGTCGILFVSWAFWIDLFISDKKLNLSQLFNSFKTVSKSAGFRIGSLILFNLYGFFFTFLNTVLDHIFWLKIIGSWLVTLFMILIVLKFIKVPSKKIGYAFFLPMTIFMFVLVLNRTFSRKHHIEKHNFKRGSQVVKGRSQSTTFIYLPNNAYESEIGLRIFPLEELMKGKNYISYEFAKGLFGIKVLKDYSFSSKNKRTTPYYLN